MTSSHFHLAAHLGLKNFLFAIFIGIGIPMSAQVTKPPQNRPLTAPLHLPPGPLTLKLVLDSEYSQCGFAYYLKGDIPTDRPIEKLGKHHNDSTLKNILLKLGLEYAPTNEGIFIRKKTNSKQLPTFTAQVKVQDDENKQTIKDAKVTPKHARSPVTTDSNGRAVVPIVHSVERATVTARHRHTEEIILNKDSLTTVNMTLEFDPMEEAILSGYENTSRIAYTGDRFHITGQQLYSTPGTNLQAALAGRIPGVSVTQSSGIPGANLSATIRGRTSILNGRDPFYVIDGVPFAAANQSLAYLQSGNAAGSLSPFSFIELTDIEKIEVLKDAAATSIYGSRGANGVILITTRRGQQQKPRFSFELSTGTNTVTRRPKLLTTHQYTQMRLEALENDDSIPDATNAPDLKIWDTTTSTDWGRVLIGQASATTQAKASVTGGDANTQYFAAINALEEKNVFPFHPTHDLLSMQGSLDHQSKDQKLTFHLSTLYDLDRNNQVINDPTQWQFLTPNAPALTQNGQLVFSTKGITFDNPLSFLMEPYKATSHNTLLDATVDYHLSRRWTISANIGCNDLGVHELSEFPIRSQPLSANAKGSSQFAFTHYASNIIEPMLTYKENSGSLWFSALAGATWQNQTSTNRLLNDSAITNDALLDQPSLAYDKSAPTQANSYYYKALFAKTTLNWKHTYILDLSARRDGSSRFGPGIRYGTFWASGFAWIFWKEKWQDNIPFISLGKLRATYGITGNDQIGAYNNWSPTAVIPFQTIPSYSITIKPGQTWETIAKTEISMDWGFLDNKILLTASWYRHRTGNQLLPDSYPNIGTYAIFRNYKHVISQASGYEFNVAVKDIDKPRLQWTTNFNLSLPTNKLIAFPNFTQSNYATSLALGKSLNVVKGYRFLGVDSTSGLFRFQGTNTPAGFNPADPTVVGNLAVTCEGGIDNTVNIGSWQIECFIEGRAQTGINYVSSFYTNNAPGAFTPTPNNPNAPDLYTNVTTDLLDHWRHPGDRTPYQKLTSNLNTTAGQLASLYPSSSAILANASFVRLKDVCITYYWPASWLKKMHLASGHLFLQGQNLATFTPYRGVDPEIQSASIMPPMRTIVIGVHLDY